MKQTNNAITFLAASYRAVFEKAYLKGFASSCALLAVATPYAYAASSGVTWGTSSTTATDVEIDDSYPASGDQTIPANAFAKSLTLSAEQGNQLKFTNLYVQGNILVDGTGLNQISASSTANISGSLQVTGNALLSLNKAYIQNGITVGSGKSNNSGSGSSLTFQNNLSGESTTYVGGNITVNGATFKAEGNANYQTQILGQAKDNLSISSQLLATTAKITIDKASVKVDGATISGSTIDIQNKLPANGSTSTPDIYSNYSSLNMGLGGSAGQSSQATLSSSTVNIGNQGLLEAQAKLVIDQGSNIVLSGTKQGSADSSTGEIAAKALLRANTATLDGGSQITVASNSNGGLQVQNFTLNSGSSINVQKDAELYVSGRNTVTNPGDSSAKNTFESGVFNFNNGTITNAGTVVLGAVNTSGKTTTGVAKYTLTQSGGTFNNSGSLQIGAEDSNTLSSINADPYTEAPGTTYYGKSGTLVNATDANIVVNRRSSLQLRGTNLTNNGNIDVKSGAELSITANSNLNNNSGSINIASGANVTIRIDALGSHKSNTTSNDETVDTADISSLGNFKNSGTITLDKLGENKAVFNLTSAQLQDVLGAQLETNAPANAQTRIKLSNDTHLRFDEDLDLGAKSLAQFSGGTDSSLQTTGTLNYTVAEATSQKSDNLRGVALIGKTLNFIGSTSSPNEININVSGDNAPNAVFVATNTVTSAGDGESQKKALSFTNAELRLDHLALDLGIDQGTSTGELTTQADDAETPSVTTGTIDVDLTFNNGAKLTVDDGSWNAKNITLNSGASLELNGSTTTDALGNVSSEDQGLTVGTLHLKSGSTTRITAGTLIANALQTTGAFTAVAGSQIKVLGDGKTDTADFYGGTNVNIINSTINLGKADDTIGLTLPDASGSFNAGKGFNKFNVEAADIYLDLHNFGSGSGIITSTQANELFDLLVDGTGLLHLEGIKTDISDIVASGSGSVDFGDLTSGSGELTLDYDTETSRETILTNVNGKVTGGWKAIKMSGSGPLQVKEEGTLGLYGTTSSGHFVEDSSGAVAGVNLTSGSTLMLQASGDIGEITGASGSTLALGNNAKVKVVNASGSGANVNVNKLLSTGALTAKDVTVNQADLTQGSQLNATTFTVNESLSTTGAQLNLDYLKLTSGSANFNGSQLQVNKDFTASGGLSFDNASTATINGTLTANQGLNVVGDSFLKVGTLIASGDGDIQVGAESGATILSSSGKLEAERISLNGNNLILDPEFGQKTATVFAEDIGAISSGTPDPSGGSTSSSVMALDGGIVVGRNSALGLGGESRDFYAALSKQQTTNGSLSETGIGAYLYVNRGNINLGNNKLIVGTDDIESLKNKLSGSASIYLGQNTAMQVTTQALKEVGTGAAIFNDLDSSKSISSKDATLIVPAGLTSQELGKLFGTEVQLEAGSSIQVTTENGLFTGVIDSSDELHGSGSVIKPSDDSREILSNLSNPTYDFVMNVLSEQTTHYANAEAYKNGTPTTSTGTDTGGTGTGGTGTGGTGTGTTSTTTLASNGISVIDDSTGFNFIREAAGSLNSRALEQGARMATLGGVMQVAMQASSTTTEAINGRLGSGQANGQNGLLNQGRTGRVWATPVYKNFSSDDFSANGLSYGPDVDLYGAAMGAEASLSNGVTAGVMFNIGTGSADGSGVSAGINNDFSYYGFGMYTNLNLSKNLNIAADVSYTTIDNDFDATSGVAGFNKLQATTDSEVLSMGVSAQYVFKSRDLMIMPHVGMRYDRIKFDGYNTKVDGNYLAHSTGATADVFSIPVGVSFFKDIRDGNWTYRPSADFSLTTNFGDDSVKNNTSFDGVYGSSINYETEFIDPLVYSASFGFTAASRNFSIGASIGYTGSANTDEFNVGLNGRWLF